MAHAIIVYTCALIALLAGCHDAGAPCGDGYCLAGTECAPGADHCVYPEQLTSCTGLADGTSCDIRGDEGACRGALCLPILCGDGIVQAGEECDGAQLGDRTDCRSLGEGFHEAGRLSCTADCKLDRSACGDRCGDGAIQPAFEACDVTVGVQTCESAGFHGGTLGCTLDCQLDVSSCMGRCGDGKRTAGEECDGTDFSENTCGTFGFYGGILHCTKDCSAIETTSCVGRCGDGIKNGPEICDRADLAGLSCQTFGWYAGTVTCGRDCLSVNRSACEDFCGDGVKNGNEQCDGLDHDGDSCIGIGALAGAYGCNAFCQPTSATCYWGRPRRALTGVAGGGGTVYGFAPDDVWITFDASSIIAHFDGRRWEQCPTENFVQRIWKHDDATYLGTTDQILLLQGRDWIPVYTAPFVKPNAIWATSLDDLWVAESDNPNLHHYDGTTWRVVQFPTPIAWLLGVAGDLWASGDDGKVYVHHDGVWQEHSVPGAVTLSAWTGRDGAIWMVRNDESWGRHIYRVDGLSWSEPALPLGRDCDGGWSDDTGTTWLHCSVGGLSEIYVENGDSWHLIATRSDGVVHGGPAGSGGLWITTSSGAYLLDGPSFEAVTSPGTGTVTLLEATAPDQLYLVQDDSLYRFGDAGWSATGITAADALWTAPDGALWVGRPGSIVRQGRDGTTTYPAPGAVGAVAGRSSTEVWALADQSVLHFDGSSWSSESIVSNPYDLAATTSQVWVVGADAVARLNDDGWMNTDVPQLPGLSAYLFAHGDDDVWVTSQYGPAMAFDGNEWFELLPAATGFSHVWRRGPTDIWARDHDGRVHYFDGTTWSPVDTSVLTKVDYLAGRSNEVWLAGADGDVVRLRPNMPTEYGGACEAPLRAYCNVLLRGHTDQAEDGPTACHAIDHGGGERHYRIEVPVSGRLTARVASHRDVDVSAVRADHRGGCDVASCVGAGAADTEVVLEVEQGQVYYLVVGAVDSDAPFTLDVKCEKI